MIITELSTSAPQRQIDYGSTEENSAKDKTVTGASSLTKREDIITQASYPGIEDIITEDGILCLIMSKLTLREAVGTCVLSPRWRHLWTHLPKLNCGAKTIFDAHTASLVTPPTSPLTLDEKLQLLQGKKEQFVQAVDTIIRQHQACHGLEEFVVRYFIRENHFHHLDEWIRVAVSSKTKVLALHLTKPFHRDFKGEKYQFNLSPLGSTSSLENLTLVACSLKLPYDFSGLRHLKILELFYIDICEEDLTRILSNCFTLEYLRLHASQKIGTLTLPNPQSRLQRLVVRYCYELKVININAVNLNRLNYNGYTADFIFKQPTQLKHASILFHLRCYRDRQRTLDYYLNKVSSSLPYLRYLSLFISGPCEVPNSSKRAKSFNLLTSMNLCWDTNVRMSLLQFATVLDACPFLEDLNLRLFTQSALEEPPQSLQKLRKKLPKQTHSHLRKIQFEDFYCDKWRIEFALYLLKNSTKLELMTIKKGRMELNEIHINNLRQAVPAKVELVIL